MIANFVNIVIGFQGTHTPTLYKDNQGALLMVNAQQPTKQTRHMAVKTFAIQKWCEKDHSLASFVLFLIR